MNQFANLESDDGDDSGEDEQSNDYDEDFEINHSDNDERAIVDAENEDEKELEVENPWTCQNLEWRPARGQLPTLHPFTGHHGFNVDVTGFSPDDFFQLVVTYALFNHFAIQTNFFAQQFIEAHPNP